MSRLGLQFGTLEDSSQQHPYPEGSHNLLEQWSLGIKLQCENAVLIKNYRVLYTLKCLRPFIIGLQLLVQPFLDIYLSHKSDPPITSHSFIFCGYPCPYNHKLLTREIDVFFHSFHSVHSLSSAPSRASLTIFLRFTSLSSFNPQTGNQVVW